MSQRVFSQTNYFFQKIFGDTTVPNSIYSSDTTYDGGYIISGTHGGSGYAKGYLIKTDLNANVIWAKTFGNTFDSWFLDTKTTIDKGFISVGIIQVNVNGLADIYILKTDSLGNVEWGKRFGGASSQDGGFSVIQTKDKGYALTGYMTGCFPWNIGSPFIIKLDSLGNTIFNKEIAFNINSLESRYGTCIRQIHDGNFILTALVYTMPNCYLYKLDSSGNIIWSKSYHLNSRFEPHSFFEEKNNDIVIAGSFDDSLGSDYNFLMKVDSTGNFLWSKKYGASGVENISDFKIVDNGYIIAGNSSSFIASGWTPYLIRTDLNGNLLWAQAYGGSASWFSKVKQNPNGDYMIFGGSQDYSFGSMYNCLVIKTDSTGRSNNCSSFTPIFSVGNIYPSISVDGYINQGCGINNVSPIATMPTIIDSTLCIDSIVISPIEICDTVFYLPNAFSPNEDGENDKLELYYKNDSCFETFHLTIYDRWGENIFETNQQNFKWDGYFDDLKLNSQVFTYFLEIVFHDEKKIIRKGNISLLR